MKDMSVTESRDSGPSVERDFRQFLRHYLPGQFIVTYDDKAERNERGSEKAGVVVACKDQFTAVSRNDTERFTVDDICAAGTVVKTLTDVGLNKFLENLHHVRQPGSLTVAESSLIVKRSGRKHSVKSPPRFLFASECLLTPSRIRSVVLDSENNNTYDAKGMSYAIFIVDRGWVIKSGYGENSPQFLTFKDEPIEGWVRENAESVLYDFVGWLCRTIEAAHTLKPMIHKRCLPGF